MSTVEHAAAEHGEGEIIEVSGLVDERWAQRIAHAIEAHDAHVVIDLTDAILVSRSPLASVLRRVVEQGHDLTRLTIVCPRVSAAMLLRRWHITDHIRVCSSAAELS